MIRHTVLFRFVDDEPGSTCLEQIRGVLLPLATEVPGVQSLTVNPDPTGAEPHWDAALVSLHDSWEALEVYQQHPAHLAAVEVVNRYATAKAIVDFEE